MATFAALLSGSAYLTHDGVIRDRITKLEAVIDVAETAAKQLHPDVAADRLTRTEAVDRFRGFV